MARDNERMYQLKADDTLLGPKGKAINSILYNMLPKQTKEKYELCKNKLFYTMPEGLIDANEDILHIDIDDEVYEDENDIDF